MNDDPCKEERERYKEANRKLMEVMKREPRMRPGTTEIHGQHDSKVSKQKPPAKEASGRGKNELVEAQQENDRALKEYIECKEKLGN